MKLFLSSLLLLVSFSTYSQTCTYCSEDTDVIGNCAILPPQVRDNNNRFCPGTKFGVTYDGFLASDHCYNTVRDAKNAMKSIKSCKKSPKRGFCRIIGPGVDDHAVRRCPGTLFGITYNGYFASKHCYATIDEAMMRMETLSSCYERDTLKSCAILYTKERDLNQKYCNEGFGVTYKGYLAMPECFDTITKAINAMKALNK